MSLTIREKTTGAVLAESDGAGGGMIRYEGNLYFAPEAVRADVLKVTDRTYTCPYKGTCFWVDFVGPDGQTVRDVAWVYENPKAGHEAVKGRYGFYSGSRGGTRQEG